MKMAGTFRYTVWDPFMIICQMATLQCAFYVSLGLWIFFFDLISGMPRSLDHIFSYEVGVLTVFIDIWGAYQSTTKHYLSAF